MDNDKVFTAYALTLIAGVAAVLAFVVTSGIAVLPSPTMYLEHLVLGIMTRAAYKGFGGFDWSDWSLGGTRAASAAAATEPTRIAGTAG